MSPMARSELHSGRARQRLRFTSVLTVASVIWLMVYTEAELFERLSALGRSNWLFAGLFRSGKRAAAIMSLIPSARMV